MLTSGRIIPVILEKGWGFPGIGPPSTFLPIYGQPGDCHGTCGYIIYHDNVL